MTLQLNQVGMRYADHVIFKDVSVTIKPDDWLTIVGPSGSGKSTLLKGIAGLLDLTDGTVTLGGQAQWDGPIDWYRQQVSYAVQSAQLFGQTVRDNLDYPFIVRNQPINVAQQHDLLRDVGLDEAMLDQPIHELSGGQRQRVGVGRNLLFPPQYLLLDEITTGLDHETKVDLWRLIRRMQQAHHFGVISITHDDDEIAHATWRLTLADGQGVLQDERGN